MYARGAIVGLTRGANRNHIIRAALESIAYQSADLLDAMAKDAGFRPETLRVDGGASANDFLMQFQADVSDVGILRPRCIETTALGAAYLAGLATGYWRDTEEVRTNWQCERTFAPEIGAEERRKLLSGWRRAVRCAVFYADEAEKGQ
jgi:glycerol kinase